MMIQQLSVFLENRAGQLSAVTELLAQNHVDMQALNIAETADYGVLRLIVDMPQRAARLLRDNGFIVRETPVVQAPVSDKPGGLNAVLSSIAGALKILFNANELLSTMTVKNTKTGELTEVKADEDDGLFGLFGFIGYNPNSQLFEGMLDMEHGYIKTDDNMHTSIPGVFAAGDIRVKSLRQVVTAAADGAIAAMQAEHYVSNH